jgi:glycosyltransferase involved in cell wall biosynthesis
MHILIINSEYPPIGGGAGNACAHIARCLAQMGHEVSIVTSRFEDLPHKEQKDGVTIHRIPALRLRRDRSTAIEQVVFIIAASFWTLGGIPKFKPDVSLAFFGIPSGAAAWLIRRIYKVPYVVSLRGGDVPGFRPYDFKIYHKLIAPFLRIVWRDASAIVANSNGLRELALEFDSRYEISVIPNGVNVNSPHDETREWQPARLLSVGRLVHQKGFDLAMRALAGLKDLQWHWKIVGDGPLLPMLRSLADELGILDRITFTGWQTKEQLTEHYKQANLFVFPSRHEGMPNAVLEAMANGLPILASRIAGNEELVADGVTGMLIPSENVASLREALSRLINDVPLRERMGKASRRRVEESYAWESTARQYALLLKQVK